VISVVIVTYNSRLHVARCLESLAASGAEIIVVDNASSDGTTEVIRQTFPSVTLLEAPRNLGFAAAANWGARQSRGEAVLFLNPDAACRSGLAPLEEVLASRPDAAAIAGRLTDAAGRTQVGFNLRRLPTAAALLCELLLLNRIFPNNPVNRRYRCLDLNHNRAMEVEQPAAACLLVRRKWLEQCGFFDESFFPLWFDDVDLCLRLRRAGGKILYEPRAVFQHRGGHSAESLTFSERQVYWYRNLLYYVRKHFPWGMTLVIRAALVVGVGMRALAAVAARGVVLKTAAPNRGEILSAYLRAAKLAFLG